MDRVTMELAPFLLCQCCALTRENGECCGDSHQHEPLSIIGPGIYVTKNGEVEDGLVRYCDGCGRFVFGELFPYTAEVEIIADQEACRIAASWQGTHGDDILFAEFVSAIAAGKWVAPAGIIPAIDRAIKKVPDLARIYPQGYVTGDLGTVEENIYWLKRLRHHIQYLKDRKSL